MVINTNVPSIAAHRSMKTVGSKQAKASARLSSGLKLNSAADDAAGLAISEKMKAQIRGMRQAQQNVEDGINLIGTMDGGMNDIQEMMIRQRELIIQGLNDTNTDEDREKIQNEIDQLNEEIGSRALNTKFNNIPLLNVSEAPIGGGGGVPLVMYKAYVSDYSLANEQSLMQTITLTNDDSESLQSFYYSDGNASGDIKFNVERYLLEIDPNFQNFTRNDLYNPDGSVNNANAQRFANVVAEAMQRGFRANGVDYTFKGEYRADGKISFEVIQPASASMYSGGCWAIPDNGFGHDYLHMRFSPDTDTQIGSGTNPEAGDLWIQSSANNGQGFYISRYDCRPEALGIKSLALKPREAALQSLNDLDTAFGKVNEYRAKAGGQQNRLEYSGHALAVSYTNLEEANSRIADADMAKEMMDLTKSNVLQQAAVSMLAQANQRPEAVLQLIRT